MEPSHEAQSELQGSGRFVEHLYLVCAELREAGRVEVPQIYGGREK